MTMMNVIRDLMIAKACGIIANADASAKYPVGTKFDFDILGDPRAEGAEVVIERVLEKLSGVDLSKLVAFEPFEVVYVAQGAPSDLICKDADGGHFYMPSGVLALMDRCKAGDFPPAFPEVEDEEEEDEDSTEELVKALMEQLKKAA
jgi:hypothetical protein